MTHLCWYLYKNLIKVHCDVFADKYYIIINLVFVYWITLAYNHFGAGDFRPDFKYVLHGDIKNVTRFFQSALVPEIKKNTIHEKIYILLTLNIKKLSFE